MAIKQVTLSDISGAELSDSDHVRVIVSEHPSILSAVSLDMTVEEASKLQAGKIELVSLMIYEPDQAPRRAVMDSKSFSTAFKGVDIENIIMTAPKVTEDEDDAPRRRTRGAGKAKTPKAEKNEKIDYTSQDYFGCLHRGRITEAEKELVRNNLDQANKNRIRMGQPIINPEDPTEIKRYFS